MFEKLMINSYLGPTAQEKLSHPAVTLVQKALLDYALRSLVVPVVPQALGAPLVLAVLLVPVPQLVQLVHGCPVGLVALADQAVHLFQVDQQTLVLLYFLEVQLCHLIPWSLLTQGCQAHQGAPLTLEDQVVLDYLSLLWVLLSRELPFLLFLPFGLSDQVVLEVLCPLVAPWDQVDLENKSFFLTCGDKLNIF